MDDPVQGDQLRSIIERIERLEEEKRTISDDIKEIYAEAKGNGYDVKVLRKVVALRKMDANQRAEFEAILDLYMQAVGEYADTPLGRAAAPGFSSRATMARSAPSDTARVSRPAEIAGEPTTKNSGQMNRLPDQGPVGREECKAAQLGPSTCEMPSGVHSGSDIGVVAPHSTEPDATPAGAVVATRSGVTSGETDADGRNVEATVEQRPSAPISGLAAANAIALRAVQPKPAAPERDLSGDMPDIPAFLLRPFNGAHPSFGEQA